MLSPEARAVAHRLIAILLALLNALAAPAPGAAPRPLMTRAVARLLAAYVRSLSRQLEDVAGPSGADAPSLDPAPVPLPAVQDAVRTKPRRRIVPATRQAARLHAPRLALSATRRGIGPPPRPSKSAASARGFVMPNSFRNRN